MRHCRVSSSLLLTLLFLACGNQPDEKIIDLTDLEPVSLVYPQDGEAVRIVASNAMSPKGTAEKYKELAAYLTQKLQLPVILIQRNSYAEANELIRSGQADAAFVCTAPYVIGHEEFGMELLVAPRVQDGIVYHSLIIVPAESEARSIADLKGKVFAFSDPMSTSGCLYPRRLVQLLGEEPESFFASTVYTYCHDEVIEAVAQDLADGGATNNLVLDQMLVANPPLRDRIRIIERSPALGVPPVVVGANLDPDRKDMLRQALLGMAADTSAAAALADLGFEGFVPIDDAHYQSVRDLVRELSHTR